MRLEYYTLLCPTPIKLSIGSVKKHTLREIGEFSFPRFRVYEAYLLLTPNNYYNNLADETDKLYWESVPDEQKIHTTLYDLILLYDNLRECFLEIFNFFFIERVIFRDNVYYTLNTDDYGTPDDEIELSNDNVVGVINHMNIYDVLDILRQVCCIKSDDPLDEQKPVFKNAKAKKLYEKMLKAKEEETKRKEKQASIDASVPNVISSTAAKSAGLNIINIWDATLFQLYDQFSKTQSDDIHYLNSVRVAVWGDEKNTYDHTLWYKNNYDKQ